ncbi:MAG TPA: ribonuclease D [Blastocatellia bacterium]|nr:ribonuclease D [Blastocatellia bacterium]
MFNHNVEYICDSSSLTQMLKRIEAATVMALDIETINWWDRERERVSLLQLAFHERDRMTVAVIDVLANFDPEPLRHPLELSSKIKVIHNASYDAVRIAHHYRIATAPIYDTMLAARRNGEKQCSLKAQTATHLGLQMDKTEQRSDWSRRPLSPEQLNYAAFDAVCTLRLYEKQTERGLRGDYELRSGGKRQAALPLLPAEQRIVAPPPPAAPITPPTAVQQLADAKLSPLARALLGIVTELSGRYSPEQLSASVGSLRVGLAGLIIDRVLGSDAEIDEDGARQEISALCEDGSIRLGPSRRLEATVQGTARWQRLKPSV